MHRHGYKGRKFGRQRDQRRALTKSLADSLVLNHSITTTLPKAKELVPYVERLITKAKKGDLHNRRQIISKLSTLEASHKLVDEIAPKLSNRSSGHLRVVKQTARKGDNTMMASVSFVDDVADKAETKSSPATKATPAKAAVKKPATTDKAKKPEGTIEVDDIPTSTRAKRAAKPVDRAPTVRKRRGIRGNR